jgi:exo-rhamnogalacturonan lyase-like protein
MMSASGAFAGTIKNPHKHLQWLRFGLPVDKGVCEDPQRLELTSESGDKIDAEFTALTRWQDGSVKWVLVDAIGEMSGAVFLLHTDGSGQGLERQHPASSVEVDFVAGNCRFSLGNSIRAEVLISVEGAERRLKLAHSEVDRGRLSTDYQWMFEVEGVRDLEVSLRVTDVPGTGHIELKPRVHNRRASLHPNGCWDLGDPNSLYIDSFAVKVINPRASDTRLELRDLAAHPAFERSYSEGVLVQYGSGGKHWDSPVHVDKNGQSTVSERGFRLFDSEGGHLAQGLRASPLVRFDHPSARRYLIPARFWENFPSSLEVKAGQVAWRLFPRETELQPGEAKTWHCDLGFTERCASFIYNPAYIDKTGVVLGRKVAATSELTDLLDNNLSGPGSFKQKREACDEYGWRNFGELYADHEALSSASDDIFVSHYNNQYDPVLGFSLRYLATGDQRWDQLASDLAQHVVDIDIYKTDQDKAEYNNGLFWHTDHYLPALTATHRTYSKDHQYAYEGHQGGGGPGGQHCYPSGLALRYLLSGDDTLKHAAIGLSQWVRCFYNGSPTVLGRLHRLLTVDLKAGKMTNIGYIEEGYKYPLDRGTGNYLNALIDAFLVGGDAGLLDEMHEIIIETVSPDDDLAARHLGNVEEHWFYIVFLQALARYLLLKEQLEQPDQHYAYGRHTFLHYAEWVLKYEETYLSNPDALEFPTDTWAAQDLRKANVLYYGAYFDPARAEAFRRRADLFWDYCVDTLGESPEAHTTRIQAIVAQNLGVREWCLERESSPFRLMPPEQARVSKSGIGQRFFMDIRKVFRAFSLTNEIGWLKGRLNGR